MFFVVATIYEGIAISTDPQALSTANSRILSIGTNNPHIFEERAKKLLYLSVYSQLTTKELKEIKGIFVFPTKIMNTKLSIRNYGYKYYHYLEISTTISKKLTEQLSIGAILNFRRFNYLGLEKSKKELLPAISIAYQHKRKLFISQITWFNPLFVKRKKNKTNLVENNFLSMGIILQTSRQTQTLFEADWIDQKNIIGRCGFIYTYKDFEIRCGIKIPTFFPCFGVGFKKNRFRIDLSGNYLHPLGTNLALGLGIQL